MAGDAKKLQPIIIKRVKKGGHAAHGGAWKIAYADFVTAMMAFFLLMWLLGSTSEGDKKGISDYFQSPLKVAMQGGAGAGASNSIISGGGNDLTQQVGQSRKGDGEVKSAKKMSGDQAKIERAKNEAQKLAALAAKIAGAISSNPRMAEFSSQIKLEVTPDGLQIQIVDDQRRPMFDSGSATVKPYMRDILVEIGAALSGVDNKISLDGHTDSQTYGNAARGYSNWELSADRANASRRELIAAGMPESKLARVVGMAASLPFDTSNPLAPTNRRISILVMTKDAEERLLGSKTVALEESEPVSDAATAAEPKSAP
jgi:chemotaxis protein MotB